MNHNKNLPLFQWKNGKYQSKISQVSSAKSIIKPEMTTKEILNFTKLPPHKLPKIGQYLDHQDYAIKHKGKNLWKLYMPYFPRG